MHAARVFHHSQYGAPLVGQKTVPCVGLKAVMPLFLLKQGPGWGQESCRMPEAHPVGVLVA